MSISHKIKSFFNTQASLKILFVKAWFLSAIVKFTLIFLPFKKVMDWQGKLNVDTPVIPDQASLKFRQSLQSAMRLCDKYTFWKTECYTQALTAKILLNSKGLPGTLYIGFRKDEQGGYGGHAWLRSYNMIITGFKEMEKFQVHSFYS